MTQTSLGEEQLELPFAPRVGDIKYIAEHGWQIYGPDPWSWCVAFDCWFSADNYFKENGEWPYYVSDANKQTLGG